MRFGRQRAERHGARDEAAANVFGRLDLLDCNRCLLAELEQVARAGRSASTYAIGEPLKLTVLQCANDGG